MVPFSHIVSAITFAFTFHTSWISMNIFVSYKLLGVFITHICLPKLQHLWTYYYYYYCPQQVLKLQFSWFNSSHVLRREGNFLRCHRRQLASVYYLNVTYGRTGLLGYRNLCLALCECSKYRHDRNVDPWHARAIGSSLVSVFQYRRIFSA